MYVSNLSIDRFGVCADLNIDSLAPGLNVIHGPRASGKTTLVDFLRAMLHGFDPELRSRYLPTDAKQFGGRVTLHGPNGQQTIRRYDNGQAGRLKVETERGLTDEPTELRELYGQVSPQLVEQIFAIDFERPTRIDRVLDLAAGHGFDLAERHADAARISSTERDLADARQRLASLPEPLESWELLTDRRRRLVDEIATLETRERRLADEQDRERARRSGTVVDLERQLADLRREVTALDASLSRLLERRRLLEVDLAALRGEQDAQPWQEELRSLDAQLDRWRRTLRDLAVAKNGLAEGSRDSSIASPLAKSEQADPRQHLKTLEGTAATLQQLLTKLNGTSSIACSCREFRVSLDDALRQIREQIYQACHSLNVWQTYFQQRIAQAENHQFGRCESELQFAIGSLTERRQRLLHGLERPSATLRPDHSELCECAEHPRLVDVVADRRPRIESLQAAVKEIDAELGRIEEQRGRLERQATELNARLETARSQNAAANTGWETLFDDLKNKREALSAVDRNLANWERRREVLSHIACLEDQHRMLESQISRSPILADASEFVRQFSDDSLQQIGRDTNGDVWVETARGEQVLWPQLSEGGRDQASLAICLALAVAAEQRGAQLPIVVNAPFSRYTDSQVTRAIRCLQRLATNRQILCFTRDEHAVRAARAANVPVGVLTFSSEIEAASRTHASAARHPIGEPVGVSPRTVRGLTPTGSQKICPPSARAIPWDAEEFPGELTDRIRMSVGRPSVVAAGIVAELDPGIGHDRDDDFDRHDRNRDYDLSENDPIDRASFLNGTEIELLRRAGVTNISFLINTSVDVLTARLRDTQITRDSLAAWQTRARQSLRSHHTSSSADRTSRSRQRDGNRERQSSTGRRSDRISANSDVVALKAADSEVQFFLHRNNAVEDAPSIGPSMARKLEEHGVKKIADLLAATPESLAEKLVTVKAKAIRLWQQQTELACRVPRLRGHDAQILVAIGVTTAEQLAGLNPAELWGRIEPFLNSNEAKRIVRGGSPPDLAEVTEWIHWSRQARTLAAA